MLFASGLDQKLLGRVDLPFGSSVVAAGRKPGPEVSSG